MNTFRNQGLSSNKDKWLKMKRVLIVEDNESNRYLARFMLARRGYEIMEAEEGVRGVEMALKNSPDLILVDIQLPDIDGLEVVKRIRSQADRNIPIVAVTSYAMPGDREKALAAGCTGYIEKPINPDTFAADIEKFLKL